MKLCQHGPEFCVAGSLCHHTSIGHLQFNNNFITRTHLYGIVQGCFRSWEWGGAEATQQTFASCSGQHLGPTRSDGVLEISMLMFKFIFGVGWGLLILGILALVLVIWSWLLCHSVHFSLSCNHWFQMAFFPFLGAVITFDSSFA
jgi:hypothetical protein